MLNDATNKAITNGSTDFSESEGCSQIRPSVLHVCKVFLPVRGGIQIVVNRIRSSLNSRYQNLVITTSEAIRGNRNQESNEIITVKSWGDILSMPISPGFIPRLLKVAKSSDLLVIHYPFPLADIAVRLAFFIRLPPMVVYWHSEIVSQKVSRLLIRPFTLHMLKKCSAIVVSSPNLIEHSDLLYDFRDKCKVIPFGYEPSQLNREVYDGGFFIFVGRHVPYKGIDILIRATAQSKVKVIIVGDGPLIDTNKELARAFNVSDLIEFRTDVNDDELERLMATCKALVLPSVLSSEAFALVQIEAMCFGKPIINTRLKSGVPWVARHEQEGLSVRPGDVDDLADALIRLQGNQKLLEHLGQGAKSRWENCFSMKKFIDATDSLFSRLLEESSSRAT